MSFPVPKEVVKQLAWSPPVPAARLIEEHPAMGANDAPPSVETAKETEPVGVPAPGETTNTVAVTLTPWPNTEGAGVATTEVEVAAGFTVWATRAEVEPVKFGSPE